jgi:hypothetical protein
LISSISYVNSINMRCTMINNIDMFIKI